MHEALAVLPDEDMVRTARIDEGADPGRNDREARVIWAAGFFDGEGSIGLARSVVTGNWSVRMSAGQLVREPLDIFYDLWGGSICLDRSLKHKPMYKWAMMSNKAVASISEMLPYLIVKKEQAKIALEFHAGKANTRYVSPEQKRETARRRQAAYRAGLLYRIGARTVPESEKARGAEYLNRIRAVRP